MIGDVVEFGQWKTHVRQESLIFAGGSIGTKVGAGVASAVMTGLLSMGGYISTAAGSVTQPDSALHMIVVIGRGISGTEAGAAEGCLHDCTGL